ncbi:MAG: radical SAM family heme chaperone HemW [Prevotellaceae bacterium]|nr:radical SAM family heme chaperone HemW [Prevotellaceae bacterium]
MPALYIHIPFCKSRCIYCGFYSTTREELRSRYVDALCREMELRRGYVSGDINTVYLGGGTPSQLSADELQRLFSYIYKVYSVDPGAEVTIECNPDDITPSYASLLQSLPVNRVSMGAQTFSDERLRFLHRRHNAQEVSRAVEILRKAGIGNISVDLMFGFPDETLSMWQSDIDSAVALGVEHISAYSLMYEEGTPLYKMLESGRVKETEEEQSLAMYNELIDRLSAAGYEHYEISNFAKPGYRSRHNSSYWRHVPYIGLGAAAHSYDLTSRQWNVADVKAYIDSICSGTVNAEREELDMNTRYNDTVMTSLRTAEGISLDELESMFGSDCLNYCLAQSRRYIADGLLENSPHTLRLTRRGLFVSDMIMSDLMIVD